MIVFWIFSGCSAFILGIVLGKRVGGKPKQIRAKRTNQELTVKNELSDFLNYDGSEAR